MPPPVILHVDDDSGDLALFERAVRSAGLDWEVEGFASAADALRFLHRLGPWKDAPAPALMVVDLDVPGLNGFDLLRSVQKAPTLRQLPLVVLTGSDDAERHRAARELGARAVLIKPSRFEDHIELVKSLRPWVLADASSALRRTPHRNLRLE